MFMRVIFLLLSHAKGFLIAWLQRSVCVCFFFYCVYMPLYVCICESIGCVYHTFVYGGGGGGGGGGRFIQSNRRRILFVLK